MIELKVLCDVEYGCETCRDPSQTEWRQSLGVAYELPPGAPDFACPRGKPWGYTGKGLGDRVAAWIKRILRYVAGPQAVQWAERCGACSRRAATLNRWSGHQ